MKKPAALLLILFVLIALLAIGVVVYWPEERNGTSPCLSPPMPAGPDTVNPIMKYGYPGTAMLRYRDGYVLSYDARNRVPFWVCERLDADALDGGANRKRSSFRADTSIAPEFRSDNGDYERSGFDRGHMAPAGDHKEDQAEMDGTFLLSNVAPQAGEGFNRDYWNSLEERIRGWARTRELYVYTGPLYLPAKGPNGKRYVRYQVIGGGGVAVPTHFFKLVVAENGGGVEAVAFVLPNRPIAGGTPLSRFLVSVDDLERVSGLDFMDVLADNTEARLERGMPAEVWR